ISAGGGIINQDGTGTLSNSTLSGNSTEYGGGGIENHPPLVMSNSTFSGNSASVVGGTFNHRATRIVTMCSDGWKSACGHSAISDGLGGGSWNTQTLTVTNTTVSGNSALSHGGGICNGGNYSDPALKIGDTILNAGLSGENIYNESGTTISLGYNLSNDNDGSVLNDTRDGMQ